MWTSNLFTVCCQSQESASDKPRPSKRRVSTADDCGCDCLAPNQTGQKQGEIQRTPSILLYGSPDEDISLKRETLERLRTKCPPPASSLRNPNPLQWPSIRVNNVHAFGFWRCWSWWCHMHFSKTCCKLDVLRKKTLRTEAPFTLWVVGEGTWGPCTYLPENLFFYK